ncbi:MAG: phosphate-starvation-inducible protein PsiE [Holosporales bacterium]|jgi:protein PsiE
MSDFHHLSLPVALKNTVFKIIDIISVVGLLSVLAATVVAIGQEMLVIIHQGKVHLTDILLLFIYMEVISMVGIYFHSNRLPVRFPVLIAMVALARHIILETADMNKWELIAMAAAIFILGVTTVLLKYGNRFDVYESDPK